MRSHRNMAQNSTIIQTNAQHSLGHTIPMMMDTSFIIVLGYTQWKAINRREQDRGFTLKPRKSSRHLRIVLTDLDYATISAGSLTTCSKHRNS